MINPNLENASSSHTCDLLQLVTFFSFVYFLALNEGLQIAILQVFLLSAKCAPKLVFELFSSSSRTQTNVYLQGNKLKLSPSMRFLPTFHDAARCLALGGFRSWRGRGLDRPNALCMCGGEQQQPFECSITYSFVALNLRPHVSCVFILRGSLTLMGDVSRPPNS